MAEIGALPFELVCEEDLEGHFYRFNCATCGNTVYVMDGLEADMFGDAVRVELLEAIGRHRCHIDVEQAQQVVQKIMRQLGEDQEKTAPAPSVRVLRFRRRK